MQNLQPVLDPLKYSHFKVTFLILIDTLSILLWAVAISLGVLCKDVVCLLVGFFWGLTERMVRVFSGHLAGGKR